MISSQKTKDILEKAEGKSVLSMGDAMLDAYLSGNVERFSQEAPVPIIDVDNEQFFPGGAGNAAACMTAIGLKPDLISISGTRGRINYYSILKEECKKRGIIPSFISDRKRKTTLKMRLSAINTTKQHVARVDIEDTFPLENKIERKIAYLIKKKIKNKKPEVITIHDYKKGFLTKNIFKLVSAISQNNNIPIFADLKQTTFVDFKNFIKNPKLFYLKPNHNESFEAARSINGFDKSGNTDSEIIEIAKIIQRDIPINIIITRGPKGAAAFEFGKRPHFVKLDRVEEQFDVAGAGDTVEAFLVASYLGGARLSEGLEIATAASQVAIRKFGTSIVRKEELLRWLKKNGK